MHRVDRTTLVKRESGVSPERSGHCIWGVMPQKSIVRSSTRRSGKAMSHESGNLLSSSKVITSVQSLKSLTLFTDSWRVRFHKEGGFFYGIAERWTWTYRIMHWLNGRWYIPWFYVSCLAVYRFCFPATNKTAHPPQRAGKLRDRNQGVSIKKIST